MADTGNENLKYLAGKVAIITGASSGIGYDLLKALSRIGIKTVGCARNISKIDALSVELNGKISGEIIAFKCDVSREDQVRSLFEFACTKYGGVDILVNNAGVGHPAPLLSGNTEDWRNMIDVNVLGLSICTREFFQKRQASGIDSGYIINMCSVVGHTVPNSAPDHFYSVSKMAVTALTEGVRQELREKKSKIRVSQVSPGLVLTEFVARYCKDEKMAEEYYKSNSYLESRDVTEAVIYLLGTPPNVGVHDVIMNPL
ncbi:Dehydrogenase/reductase SDR family member 11 [Oopsacas minuta]|uniref:Dehydrogenase/reductase SDR family member 11 n=1 Tax=Oopsacas minuta TaxID=111878 RepID=A0AAV7JGF9_9METZ|nr:Dehydrogenase/reductase SDR family member 11 [Oopsacas minuta]